MIKTNNLPKTIIILVTLITFLSGCVRYKIPVESPEPPMVTVDPSASLNEQAGNKKGGIIGMMLKRYQSLPSQLLNSGIQVIRIGDQIGLLIPSDQVFLGKTANLNPRFLPTLQKVALFLRGFKKSTVKIAAYTDNQDEWQYSLALSNLQAKVIESKLASLGIGARILYSIGYGAEHPISDNISKEGRYQNRRVEITFSKLERDVLV